MLGQVEGAATENQVAVKNIQRAGQNYPYVSAQALRYWWRNALEAERGWEMSPIEREKKIAFTQAKPWQYADDDVFGYMRAQAEWVADVDKKTGEPKRDPSGEPILKKGKNITLTRNSPLKCSPLVSVISQRPTRDFGTMSRQDGDPVPYERQFYSTVLKGIFSLDITALGHFQKSNRTGFQNISEEGLRLAEEAGASVTGGLATISLDERRKRAQDTISVLPYLSGGANQTLHLTDVTPKLVVLTILRGGNQARCSLPPRRRRSLPVSRPPVAHEQPGFDESQLSCKTAKSGRFVAHTKLLQPPVPLVKSPANRYFMVG